MRVDYIIVGCGLAGIAFCEQLRKHNKSFVVFDDGSQQSSKVAGGLYNPVILKRFTAAWKAKELLELAMPFYSALEKYLDIKLNETLPVLRIFASAEEQNNWFAASDKPILSEFILPQVIQNNNPSVNANFGLGEVQSTGRINTELLVKSYSEKLKNENRFIKETFNYSDLEINNDDINYQHINARHLIFSQGFGLKRNPYFNYLPLKGSKGEYITINAPDLKLDVALKGPVFVIPLKDDQYLVGATYDNEDKSNLPTDTKKEELVNTLKKMITCNFKVIDQVAGIRPTVKDRRPLVGIHPKFKNLAVLNGLGTRGVMIAPYIAEQLYRHLESGDQLDSEIDITRFTEWLFSSFKRRSVTK